MADPSAAPEIIEKAERILREVPADMDAHAAVRHLAFKLAKAREAEYEIERGRKFHEERRAEWVSALYERDESIDRLRSALKKVKVVVKAWIKPPTVTFDEWVAACDEIDAALKAIGDENG